MKSNTQGQSVASSIPNNITKDKDKVQQHKVQQQTVLQKYNLKFEIHSEPKAVFHC